MTTLVPTFLGGTGVDATSDTVEFTNGLKINFLHVEQTAGTLPGSSTNGIVVQKNASTSDIAVIRLIGGAAADSRVEFGDAGDRDIGMIRYTHGDNAMEFYTNASEQMTITSAGIVVIGHTASVITSSALQASLQIMGTDFNSSSISAMRWSADANGASINLGKSRNGTIGSNTVVSDGDELGKIDFSGDDGTDYQTLSGRISSVVNGTPGTGDIPADLVFSSGDGGSVAEVLRLAGTGLAASFTGDVNLKHDGAILRFGDGLDVTQTHVHDVGLDWESSRSGADSIFRFKNIANASASDIRLILQNGGTSGGDPIINLDGQASNASWTIGVDTSATKFVIADADKGGFDGNDEVFTIATGGSTTITTADNNAQLTLVSTDADANGGAVLDLHRNSASPADADFVGEIYFHGEDDAGNKQEYASIKTRAVDVSSGSEDGRLEMYISTGGSMKSVFLAHSPATPEIAINEDSEDINFRVESNGNANMLFVDAGNDRVGIGQSAPVGVLDIVGNSDSVPAIKIGANTTHGFEIYELATGGHLRLNRVVSGSSTQVLHIARDTGTVTLNDDLVLGHDGAILKFGADGEVNITHVHDTGLTTNKNLTAGPGGTGTDKIVIKADGGSGAAGGGVFEVRSNGTFRGGLGNKAALAGSGTSTDLELRAASGIPITFAPNNTNALTLDTSGNAGFAGNIVIPNGGNIGSASDTDSIAIDSSGNVTASQNLTVTGTITTTSSITGGSASVTQKAGLTPVGSIIAYGSTTVPTGWLACDDSAVSRTTFSVLFAVLGTSYGAGNGSTTFNVPDLRDRMVMGKGTNNSTMGASSTGASGSFVVATASGSASLTKTTGTFATSAKDSSQASALTNVTAGGHTHNVTMPAQVCMYIIKA